MDTQVSAEATQIMAFSSVYVFVNFFWLICAGPVRTLQTLIGLCLHERADRRPTFQGAQRFVAEMLKETWTPPPNADPLENE